MLLFGTSGTHWMSIISKLGNVSRISDPLLWCFIVLTSVGLVFVNEIDLRVQEVKRLMGLKTHHDGFKLVNSLEWWSAVASMR